MELVPKINAIGNSFGFPVTPAGRHSQGIPQFRLPPPIDSYHLTWISKKSKRRRANQIFELTIALPRTGNHENSNLIPVWNHHIFRGWLLLRTLLLLYATVLLPTIMLSFGTHSVPSRSPTVPSRSPTVSAGPPTVSAGPPTVSAGPPAVSVRRTTA